MKKITLATAALAFFLANTAFAEHAYINFDDDGNMVLTGPFDVVIPRPEGARLGQPENSSPSFLDEKLKVSKAGFFADDQFVMVQIETTNAPAGTLTNKNLPVYDDNSQLSRLDLENIVSATGDLHTVDESYYEMSDGEIQILVNDYMAGRTYEAAGQLLDDLSEEELRYLEENFDVGDLL